MCTRAKNLNFRAAAAALLFALPAAFWGCGKDVEVEIAPAEKRTIIAKVSETGTIEPDVQVPVAPDVSGEIIRLEVKEGDYVNKGDLLFEIRPDNIQAAYEQARASLNSAKADHMNAGAALKQAESNLLIDSANYVRNKQLFDDKVIAQAEFDNFRRSYQVAKANVEAAEQAKQAAWYRVKSSEASVRQTYDDLTRTRVFAPMSGAVTALNVELGQRVVGTGMMSGTEAIKIADLTRMKVKVLINENDVVRLQPGDSADVEIDAYDDFPFKGKVLNIAYSAQEANLDAQDQVTNYEVEVLIEPSSYQNDKKLMAGLKEWQSPLRPGMSAVVNIFTDRAEGIVSVPIQAVTLARNEEVPVEERDEIVFVIDTTSKIVSARTVVSGLSDEEYIELKSGLKPGETVVKGPYNVVTKELRDGMEVALKTEEKERKGRRR